MTEDLRALIAAPLRRTIPFDRAVSDQTAGQPQVLRRDYLSQGVLPVVDQGSAAIAGYTDDEDSAYKGPLPVLLFGDHTRLFKYVDFAFALGADGVKVLQPAPWYEPKFLYYYLLTQHIPAGGYSRHFKYLKQVNFPFFVRSEQRRIVEILDQADRLRRLRAEANAKAERILPALFIKMFGDPATNPRGWKVAPLRELTSEFRYGTSTKCSAGAAGLPVLRIPNILGAEIDLTDLKYAELPDAELERLRLFPGDLLFVRTNGNCEYVGRCAVFDLDDSYLFASYLIRARLDPSKADPWYVGAFMRTPRGRLVMTPFIRTTAGQSNISVNGLSQIPVPCPPLTEQRKFRTHVSNLGELKRQRESAAALVQQTFATVLHRAFSGELTASWREAHMNELLQEMELQAKVLATG